jgi:hypothetical protein
MKTREQVAKEIWKQHRENKNHKHELKCHFCRACIDLALDKLNEIE